MASGFSTLSVQLGEDASGWRLDRALAVAVPTLSRERLKALLSSGQVIGPQGLARDPSSKAVAGTRYEIKIADPTVAHNQPQDIPLEIVFEDDHLLVVNKPAGLVVHPAAGNFDGTLVNALLYHCAGRLSGIGGVARPGIVHRIDKDTSGLLLVAKTDRAHEHLSSQFASHTIDRRYMAIVTGMRVHMASIGHQLLGDPVYGRMKPAHRAILKRLEFERQALHAARLGFVHPVTNEIMSFESEMPEDMQQLFTTLAI
jgi:23S rRNA pseudouridine1911/1915/1917 synthase